MKTNKKTHSKSVQHKTRSFNGQGKTSQSGNYAAQIERLMTAEEKSNHKFHLMEDNKLIDMVGLHRKKRSARRVPRLTNGQPVATKRINPGPKPVHVPAPITRLTIEPPALGSAAANSSGMVAADVGAQFAHTLDVGTPWANAVYNGVAEGDVRYPDPFTLAKTSIMQTRTVVSVIPSYVENTAASDYTGFMTGIVKGSGVNTFSYAAPTIATAGEALHWDTYNVSTNPKGNYWITTTAAANTMVTRPNGIVLTIKPMLRGISHNITICAFPIAPTASSTIVQQPAGWPATEADLHMGVTSAQATWGGRMWEFTPQDECVKLVTLPVDARSLDFANGTAERGSYATAMAISWTGWVFWIYGLDPMKDTIQFTCLTVEEMFNIGSTSTTYAYPADVKRSDILLAQKSTAQAVDAANQGMAASKWSDVLWNAAKTAGKYAIHELASHGGAFLGEGSNYTMSDFQHAAETFTASSMRSHPVIVFKPETKKMKLEGDEEKTEEQLEIVTPKSARRPSLALSLTAKKK